MSDRSKASVESRASSSSFMSDRSYSNQTYFASHTYSGSTSSGSSTNLHQRRPRKVHSRPSVFSSLPRVYKINVQHEEKYMSAEFKSEQLQEDIRKSTEGEVVIYPKNILRSSEYKTIFQGMKECFEKEGAFIFFGSSMLLLLNVPFSHLRKCSAKLVGDVCIFSKGRPVHVLTIVCADVVESVFKEYNSVLVQTLHSAIREDLTGFRALHGVILLSSFTTGIELGKQIKKLDESSSLPACISGDNLKRTIESFLKRIALSTFNVNTDDSSSESVYMINKLFENFIELMEEINNVAVISPRGFSLCLLCEMVNRLSLVGSVTIFVKGYDVVPELHSLGKHCQNSSVVIVYDQDEDSTNMKHGDICLTSTWKDVREWVFQKDLIEPVVAEGTVKRVAEVFESLQKEPLET